MLGKVVSQPIYENRLLSLSATGNPAKINIIKNIETWEIMNFFPFITLRLCLSRSVHPCGR